MRALWLVIAVACSGTRSGELATPSGARETKPSGGVVLSRHAVVRQAFAALANNDQAALSKLSALPIQCPPAMSDKRVEEFRAGAAGAVKAVKGARFELLHIDELTLVPERSFRRSDGKCALASDALAYRARVSVRDEATKAEQSFDLTLYEVGNRWYLGGFGDFAIEADVVTTLREFQQQMCACKSRDCVDQVTDRMTKFSESMSEKYRDRRPDQRVMEQLTEITAKMGECMTKVMQGP